jgi:selenocysteine lyase/cysteine desulfurase
VPAPLLADRFDAGPGYLNTASLGIPPRAAAEVLRAAVSEWAHGERDAPDYDRWVDGARAIFARLVGAAPADVAIAGQVSAFMAMVASALPAGAQVVAYRADFASVLAPLLVQADRGVDVRLVELGEVADAIGPDTALVAVSAVQSADGAVADLEAIAAAAEAHGALTFVDATHACGWLPLEAGRFDFLACAAYKWLLCPRGTTFMAVRPGRLDRAQPIAAGWFAGADRWGETLYGPALRLAPDARRLDLSPAWLSWVGAVPALELIEELGVERIHAHDLALANRFRVGLGMPPSDSAIVAVDAPGGAERLAAAGVRAATRAGGLRASFHLYNSDADVDRALDVLSGGS